MKILYFAWVREKIGIGEEEVAPPPTALTAASLLDWLARQSAAHADALSDASRLRIALDQKHAPLDSPIAGVREVAIFPPVTGGSTDRVLVQQERFDTAAELARLQHADNGAVVSFTGQVRRHNEGSAISALTLEHYPGMTERAIADLVAAAHSRWALNGVTVIHRYGRLTPGEAIVLVITASAHRRAAFEAAAFLMDRLKTEAPFWKQEDTPQGPRWVEARQSDGAAAARWQSGAS